MPLRLGVQSGRETHSACLWLKCEADSFSAYALYCDKLPRGTPTYLSCTHRREAVASHKDRDLYTYRVPIISGDVVIGVTV